jgi:hypothetical protein
MRAHFHEKRLLCASRCAPRDGSARDWRHAMPVSIPCPHEATHFELRHGRLRLPVRLCAFHFEELGRLVKRQGKDWGATACDWRDARLWAVSRGLKSGL